MNYSTSTPRISTSLGRGAPEHPPDYCCPIGGDLMRDPVSVAGANPNHVYERGNIVRVMEDFKRSGRPATSPMTREVYSSKELERSNRKYEEIDAYSLLHPEFKHRMRRQPARTPEQVCLAIQQFAERSDAWNTSEEEQLVKHSRWMPLLVTSVATPILCTTFGARTQIQNILVNAGIGAGLLAYNVTSLTITHVQRARKCRPQRVCIDEIQKELTTQSLSPSVQAVVQRHIAYASASLTSSTVIRATHVDWLIIGVAWGVAVGSVIVRDVCAGNPSLGVFTIVLVSLYLALILLTFLPENISSLFGFFSQKKPDFGNQIFPLHDVFFPPEAAHFFVPSSFGIDVGALDDFVGP